MKLSCIYQKELFEQDFKIYGTKEKPLFLAKDVAEWIDYAYKDKNHNKRNVTMMLQTIDDDEKEKHSLLLKGNNFAPQTNIVKTRDSRGGLRDNVKLWFVTEFGLYEVLMQSRKPIAKKFKKEVKKILKEIRLTGGYLGNTNELSDAEVMAKALQIANNVLDRRNARIKELEKENENLEFNNTLKSVRMKEMQPKVDYHDIILNCRGTIKTSIIAKDYGLTAQEFNKILADLKIQFKQGGIWLLYKEYANQGYTQSKTYYYVNRKEGELVATEATEWTQKGRKFLYQTLRKNNIVPMIEKTGAWTQSVK